MYGDLQQPGLWDHPAMQSGLLPFLLALVVALVPVPDRLRPWRSALALLIGFLGAAALFAGLRLLPLSSTRKILLLGVVLLPVGLVLDWRSPPRRWLLPMAGVSAAAAGLWLSWPVLARQGAAHWPALLAQACLYPLWLGVTTARLHPDASRLWAAATVLGMGTGLAALLGASALLGQMGMALGSAAAAVLLVQWLFASQAGAASAVLATAMLCALVAVAGVVFAGLPWVALLCLGLVPLAASIPAPGDWGERRVLIWHAGAAALPAAVAVALTWGLSGPVPM